MRFDEVVKRQGAFVFIGKTNQRLEVFFSTFYVVETARYPRPQRGRRQLQVVSSLIDAVERELAGIVPFVKRRAMHRKQ